MHVVGHYNGGVQFILRAMVVDAAVEDELADGLGKNLASPRHERDE